MEKNKEICSMCKDGPEAAGGSESTVPFHGMQSAVAQLQYEDAERRRVLRSTLAALADLLFPYKYVDPRVHLYGRVKSIAATTEKMARNSLAVHQVLDIIGVRAITRHTRDCYRLANRIKGEFEVVENEHDDYIAAPKPNGYRSIHITVTSLAGFPVEIQFRTPWMHMLSEFGSASHRQYKRDRALWIPLPWMRNQPSALRGITNMQTSMRPPATLC